MSLNRKLRLLAFLPASGLLLAGCGGLNTTQSVSPASFFLPGFMQIQPERKSPDLLDDPATALAGRLAPTQTQIP